VADQRVASAPTSKQELDELRAMVATNLKDAHVADLSAQGRYEFAYNAARLQATIVIRASGYRVISKGGHHFYTFQALAAAGTLFAKAAAVFDSARSKRNDFSYDTPVPVSDTDADDLVGEVEHFLLDAENWIRANYPRLA
jgi:hypothetical protein